ncbi:unnamed protein product [Blepharisma stoltei]|uniref:Cyclic nucleotide-binding domain-containing protein n=1 Tax=Blepharisma stoltei TaxID=1481888 RepID=A0AAU9IRF2_9CILI|nr:unnamed protein product [Blepharisma stoltei]
MNAYIINRRRSKRRYSDISLMSSLDERSFIDESPEIEPPTEAWFPSRQITRSHLSTPSSIFLLESEVLSQKSFIIQPECKFILYWDIAVSVLIAVQLIYTPIVLFMEDSENKKLRSWDILINELFILDIIVKFNTASYSKGHIIKSRIGIAKKYLTSWFLYDIIVSIPIQEFYELFSSEKTDHNSYEYFSMHRIFEYTKIIRVVRVVKLAKTMTLLEDYVKSKKVAITFRFFKLMFIVFYINHCVACLWYYINYVDSFTFPLTWTSKLHSLGHFNLSDLYIRAFYFAITTTSTLGYGDIDPLTIHTLIFDIFNMWIAVIIVSYIIGNISDWVVAETIAHIDFRKRMVNINNYMNVKKLPRDLKFKLRTYFDFIRFSRPITNFDELQVFDLLSAPLREEIAGITRGKVFKECSIFRQLYSTKLINEICKKIKVERYAPDDVVFEEGEKGQSIYFISSGIVEVYHKGTLTIFKELNEESSFGEIGFFAMHPREASIRCLAFCEFMVCHRSDLNEILKTKPEARQKTDMLYNFCQREVPNKYTALGTRCFLCNTLGHTAAKCYKVLVKICDDDSKEKWLKEREFGKKIRKDIVKKLRIRQLRRTPGKYSVKFPVNIKKPLHETANFSQKATAYMQENETFTQKASAFIKDLREEHFKTIRTDKDITTRKTYLNVLGNPSSESSDEESSCRGLSDISMTSGYSHVNSENLSRFRSDKSIGVRGSSRAEENTFFEMFDRSA